MSMAHSLGHNVVAEGIERRQQLEILKDLDCDMIQGFLLGEPVSADRIGPLLPSDPAKRRLRLAV
ncbi:EAL domain-containing protein [Rhizobium alvei]|uniref:EAL domain-containing protein n=1 Tax=Rhizobium alvei TaxID=1132659 RepID=UPI003399A934